MKKLQVQETVEVLAKNGTFTHIFDENEVKKYIKDLDLAYKDYKSLFVSKEMKKTYGCQYKYPNLTDIVEKLA